VRTATRSLADRLRGFFHPELLRVGPDGFALGIFKLWRGRVDFGRQTVRIFPLPRRGRSKSFDMRNPSTNGTVQTASWPRALNAAFRRQINPLKSPPYSLSQQVRSA